MTWPEPPPPNSWCVLGHGEVRDYYDKHSLACPDVAKESVKVKRTGETIFLCVYHAQRLAKQGSIERDPERYPPEVKPKVPKIELKKVRL